MITTKEELENFVTNNWDQINTFIDSMQGQLPMPIYTSVDIRESTTRFAPVDNNLYPAGFNNICSLDLNVCSDRIKAAILQKNPNCQRVAIIPESHTKNKFYLDHLHTLKSIIAKHFPTVDIISPDLELFSNESLNHLGQLELQSNSGHNLLLIPAKQVGRNLLTSTETPYDVILLNHDQSKPLPVDWNNCEPNVFPSPFLGWTARQKNLHFSFYEKITNEFCDYFKIDPNLIRAKFIGVEGIDFETKEGLEKLGDTVELLKAQITEPDPTIFVKASQGTYGMGISVVKSKDDIISMNRKTRNKMDVGKNNIKFMSLLVQEGIETMIKVDSHPAEVTIYLIAGKSSGGFMRINPLKNSNSNLNSKGMIYKKYCISEICQGQDYQCKEAVYCMIARLSTVATALELSHIN